MNKKRYSVLLLIVLFVLPIIYFLTPYAIRELRLPVLLLVLGITILHSKKHQPKELGFVNITHGLKEYLYLLAVLLSSILLLKIVFQPPTQTLLQPHFYGIFILLSFAQEFMYRSFIYVQKYGKSQYLIASSLLYGFLHTLFMNPWFSFIVASMAGLVIGYTYLKKQNFWLVSIVHAIANFFAVWMGFFV